MRTKYLSTSMLSAALFSTALIFTSCGPQGRTDRMETPAENNVNDLDVERAEVESDLLELRTKLDSRIEEVDARMATADVEDRHRADLIRYREELQDRRNRVERARRDVDAAGNDTWTNVRVATNNTADDIRTWFDEQEDRLESIFREDGLNDGLNDQEIQEHPSDDNDGILQNGDIIDQDGVDD